jgi:hypothetical protein
LAAVAAGTAIAEIGPSALARCASTASREAEVHAYSSGPAATTCTHSP